MIFLDMDGVLCDFISAAFAVHGSKYDPKSYPSGEFDCEKILGCSKAEFWQKIDFCGESFWENLEPYDYTIRLVNELQQLGNVVIATSPSRSPYSYSGKRRWLQKMGLSHLDSMFGSKKWLMAGSGRILIDDAIHNTEAWEQHGGASILVPQPWNNGLCEYGNDLDIVDLICESIELCRIAL
jgi:5'(3')-deoxyribonucleotidase